jgi:hypothetical protein
MAEEKENDHIEVEIEDTEVSEVKAEISVAPVEKQETPQKEDVDVQSESVKRRIDKLTYRLREAERREQAALDYARGLRGEVDTHRSRAEILDKTLVQEFDNRLKAQEVLAREKLKQSLEMNDVDGQINAQHMLANLAVENDRLRSQKMRRQQEENRPQVVEPQYAPPAPENRPDPKAEDWAGRNTWFGTDKIMTEAAMILHRELVETEGYDPRSDDYYTELDRRVKNEFPHKFQQARQASSPVASARGNPRTDGKKQVKLTPTQVSIAKRLGVSLEEYARHAQKLNG